MQNLIIKIEESNDIINSKSISFSGDFDGYIKENLTEILELTENATEETKLIFDFTNLNYLNSYAIGHIVAWHNKLAEKKGEIIVIGINKNVEDIFSILGVNSLFKTFPNLESAKKGIESMI